MAQSSRRNMSRNVLPHPGKPESDLEFTGRIGRDWAMHHPPSDMKDDAMRLAFKTTGPIKPLDQKGVGRWFNREIAQERAAKRRAASRPVSKPVSKGRR